MEKKHNYSTRQDTAFKNLRTYMTNETSAQADGLVNILLPLQTWEFQQNLSTQVKKPEEEQNFFSHSARMERGVAN